MRVAALGESSRRVLVATTAALDGINLQEHFDAVVTTTWPGIQLDEQREGASIDSGTEIEFLSGCSLTAVGTTVSTASCSCPPRRHRNPRDSSESPSRSQSTRNASWRRCSRASYWRRDRNSSRSSTGRADDGGRVPRRMAESRREG